MVRKEVWLELPSGARIRKKYQNRGGGGCTPSAKYGIVPNYNTLIIRLIDFGTINECKHVFFAYIFFIINRVSGDIGLKLYLVPKFL